MTNFEYEDRFDAIRRTLGTDDAVDDIHSAQWPGYCDVFEHRMTDAGHRLGRRDRRWCARCVLFLRSQPAIRNTAIPPLSPLESLWLLAVVVLALIPSAAVFVGLATSKLALAASGCAVVVVSWIIAWSRHSFGCTPTERTTDVPRSQFADEDFWPFATESEFRESLSRPTYLSGFESGVTIGRP
ncbi:MAG: hypothetical protein ACKVZJ_05825 [Phycisphaerales bacterium]